MSMLLELIEDFELFLDDWGETIVINHITSQSLNATTGNYTTVNFSSSVSAIINTITKKDILINPNKFLGTELAIFCRISDCVVIPQVGDTLNYNFNNYKILETQDLKGVIKMIVRR